MSTKRKLTQPSKNTIKQAVSEYTNSLKILGVDSRDLGNVPKRHSIFEHYDGRILFENRLTDFVEDKIGLDNAKVALRHFFETLHENCKLKIEPVNPYYALLLADGDYMGKLIDKKTTVKEHRNLSQRLAKFAENVRVIVEDTYQGELVYSGGDDVLAFLPLHTALECANALAQDFKGKFGKEQIEVKGKMINSSLSAGIVVAHHLDPLSDTLKLVREAEKEAKKERNSLAITMAKRSGADYTIAGRWDETNNLFLRLTKFIGWHNQEAIPDGAAYELEQLAKVFDKKPENVNRDQYQNALEYEVKRIIGRKKAGRGSTAMTKDDQAYLVSLINQGLYAQRIADELTIAKEFSRVKFKILEPEVTV